MGGEWASRRASARDPPARRPLGQPVPAGQRAGSGPSGQGERAARPIGLRQRPARALAGRSLGRTARSLGRAAPGGEGPAGDPELPSVRLAPCLRISSPLPHPRAGRQPGMLGSARP